MDAQACEVLLMIKPAAFGFNPQTAATNLFQNPVGLPKDELQQSALKEFEKLTALLIKNDFDLMVYDDTAFPEKPDAVFCNNWFCTLPDGSVTLFPMFTPNRVDEVREDIIEDLCIKFNVSVVEHLADNEAHGKYLESTGSMVIDYVNKIIYAAISERTNEALVVEFARKHGYKAICFNTNNKGEPVYHTNVVMAIGNKYALVCEEVITDDAQRKLVRSSLEKTGHEVIGISAGQLEQFAGNVLEVRNKKGKSFCVMSTTAFNALNDSQKSIIAKSATILHSPVETIEKAGGGSVRCMLANIHLKKALPPEPLNQ